MPTDAYTVTSGCIFISILSVHFHLSPWYGIKFNIVRGSILPPYMDHVHLFTSARCSELQPWATISWCSHYNCEWDYHHTYVFDVWSLEKRLKPNSESIMRLKDHMMKSTLADLKINEKVGAAVVISSGPEWWNNLVPAVQKTRG